MSAWIESLRWMVGRPICWLRSGHVWGDGERWRYAEWMPLDDIPDMVLCKTCRICGEVEFYNNPEFAAWTRTYNEEKA